MTHGRNFPQPTRKPAQRRQLPAVRKNSLAFDELGIYRLFFRAEDTALLKKMRDEQLLLLKDYDRAHHAHLLSTLRAYLFHNNSLQQTAALTFTHRNTVNYRMNKIKELTGSGFTDSVVCFHYMLAFYMEDYLRLHEPNSEKLYTAHSLERTGICRIPFRAL